MSMEHKVIPFSLTTLDPAGRTVEGYAAAFGNVDRVKDIIHPGAFSKTISERGNKVRFLWQHDQKEPIGRPLELREDAKGLFIKAIISDTARGRDALALLRDGAVDSMSIGYESVNHDFSQVDKDIIRNLREIKLHEVSLVTMPANEEATVTAVKADDAIGPAEGKPWNVFRREGEYCVFKLDADGKPTGETLGCHPNEAAARAQVEALYANEGRDASKSEDTMEEKTGRVLSAKNRERIGKWLEALSSSVAEIRGLLDETDPERETGETPEAPAPEKQAAPETEAKTENAEPDALPESAPLTEQAEAARLKLLADLYELV